MLVHETVLEERYWHFELYVPTDVVQSPPQSDGGPGLGETETLALYQRPDLPMDIEILGHWLEYEVDAADWLELEVDKLGHRVVSRSPMATEAGVDGDLVVTWRHEERDFVGRYVARKFGPRLYLICGRVPAEVYDGVAETFHVAAASLSPLSPWPGLFAENVIYVDEEQPFSWRAAVPVSWEIEKYPDDESGAWFEALHVAPSAPHEQTGEHDGRLSLAVMTRSSAKRPRDAANVYLHALRQNDVQIATEDFAEESDPSPGAEPPLQSWVMTSEIERLGAPGELRCRVGRYDHAWVVAGVIGPRRADDGAAWMRNKRALDLATSTLRMDTSI
jgi:hypothetical protein